MGIDFRACVTFHNIGQAWNGEWMLEKYAAECLHQHVSCHPNHRGIRIVRYYAILADDFLSWNVSLNYELWPGTWPIVKTVSKPATAVFQWLWSYLWYHIPGRWVYQIPIKQEYSAYSHNHLILKLDLFEKEIFAALRITWTSLSTDFRRRDVLQLTHT